MKKISHAVLYGITVLVLAAGGGSFGNSSAQAGEVLIFGAASTTTALQDLIGSFQAKFPDDRVVSSFASSSTLAKQVANGAPADIFLSASRQWMDFVVERKAVDAGSVVELLTNRLVLIAPADTDWTLSIGASADLLGRLLDGGYLAMGDPDHVPAGIYGRQALTSLGLWEGLSGRVARAANVRAALVLVERGEAAAGVVYATDAAISRKVRVIGTFPESSHTPIIYPAALIDADPSEPVRRFFDFMRAPEAVEAWRRQGFSLFGSGAAG